MFKLRSTILSLLFWSWVLSSPMLDYKITSGLISIIICSWFLWTTSGVPEFYLLTYSSVTSKLSGTISICCCCNCCCFLTPWQSLFSKLFIWSALDFCPVIFLSDLTEALSLCSSQLAYSTMMPLGFVWMISSVYLFELFRMPSVEWPLLLGFSVQLEFEKKSGAIPSPVSTI